MVILSTFCQKTSCASWFFENLTFSNFLVLRLCTFHSCFNILRHIKCSYYHHQGRVKTGCFMIIPGEAREGIPLHHTSGHADFWKAGKNYVDFACDAPPDKSKQLCLLHVIYENEGIDVGNVWVPTIDQLWSVMSKILALQSNMWKLFSKKPFPCMTFQILEVTLPKQKLNVF